MGETMVKGQIRLKGIYSQQALGTFRVCDETGKPTGDLWSFNEWIPVHRALIINGYQIYYYDCHCTAVEDDGTEHPAIDRVYFREMSD